MEPNDTTEKNMDSTKKQDPEDDVLKPSEKDQDIKKPKKKRGWKIFLIVLIIIILVIIVGVGATGLYNIPLVSSLLGTDQPKDLGVEVSQAALDSLKEDIPMAIAGEEIEYSETNLNEVFSGQMDVETEITANEITSWLRRHQAPNPIVTDLQVRQFEGGMEISGMLNQYIDAPVYAKVNIDLTSPTSVALNFEKIKVGVFSVPEKYLAEAEKLFQDTANRLITTIPGFSIDTYELHDGYTNFKGTWPENVRPSPNGWTDLLNL